MDALQSEFAQVQHVVEDEEEKKEVVLNAVRSKCNSIVQSNEKEELGDLGRLAHLVESGSGTLQAELIAGGKTNYSFKVFVSKTDSTNEGEKQVENAVDNLAIYTKLYLPHAIWDKDHNFEFDIERAVSEFETLQKLDRIGNEADATPFPVVSSYCVLDVEGDAKLLLAEWATNTEEQWANQFIDGEVDERIVHKAAEAFAILNLTQVDQAWNDSARSALLSVCSMVKLHFTKLTMAPDEDCDALMNLLKEVGQGTFDNVVDKYSHQIMEVRESLCHSDSHPFNILVETKCKSTENDYEKVFGPNGNVILCDWETAICGPLGRDAGTFMSFPTACALCLAVQGHKDEAMHLVDCAAQFWDTYAKTLSERTNNKKDEAELCTIYRAAMAAMGSFLLFNLYMLGVLMDTLPLEGVPGDEADKARASIGIVGMKLLLVGFGETTTIPSTKGDENQTPNLESLDGLKEFYQNLMNNQIDELVLANRRTKPRRASFLRSLHRRVSDASTVEEATKRLTTQGLDHSFHRRISAFDSSDLGASMCSFMDDDLDMFPVSEEMKMQWADD